MVMEPEFEGQTQDQAGNFRGPGGGGDRREQSNLAIFLEENPKADRGPSSEKSLQGGPAREGGPKARDLPEEEAAL